jgi:hypothetical protein
MASSFTSSQENNHSDIEKHASTGLDRTGDAIIDMELDSKTPTAVNTASTRISQCSHSILYTLTLDSHGQTVQGGKIQSQGEGKCCNQPYHHQIT